jgi:hypothetical protein
MLEGDFGFNQKDCDTKTELAVLFFGVLLMADLDVCCWFLSVAPEVRTGLTGLN